MSKNQNWIQQSKRKNETKLELQNKKQKIIQRNESVRIKADKKGYHERCWLYGTKRKEIIQMIQDHPIKVDVDWKKHRGNTREMLIRHLNKSTATTLKEYVNMYRRLYPLRGPEFNPHQYNSDLFLEITNKYLIPGKHFTYIELLKIKRNSEDWYISITEYEINPNEERTSLCDFNAHIIKSSEYLLDSYHTHYEPYQDGNRLQIGSNHKFQFIPTKDEWVLRPKHRKFNFDNKYYIYEAFLD